MNRLLVLYSGKTFTEKLVLHGNQKLLSIREDMQENDEGPLTETFMIVSGDGKFEVQVWGLDWDGMRHRPVLLRRFTKYMDGDEINADELPQRKEVDYLRQLAN